MRVEFLPYQGLIAVLAYYLHEVENETVKPAHQDTIDRWFWRVVVSDHWESTRQTQMSNDAELMDRIIAGADVEIDYPVTLTADKLINGNIKRSKSKMRNAFLCILANQKPRNFEDGTEIELSSTQYSKFNLERHHIFPNAYLRQEGYSKSDRKSLMDITFLPSSLNNSISDQAPHVYLSEYQDRSDFEEIMSSHLIPISNGAAIWNDDYEAFQEQRANQFMSAVRDLAGDFSGFDDDDRVTPMDRINHTEELVRDLVDDRLTEEHGERYWSVMPSQIAQRVEDRISQSDFSGESDRDKLEYVKMNECAQIMDLYWSQFEDEFPSSEDTEHHLSNLEAYKRELEEGEDVDEYTELDGKLAVQWCNSCIQPQE